MRERTTLLSTAKARSETKISSRGSSSKWTGINVRHESLRVDMLSTGSPGYLISLRASGEQDDSKPCLLFRHLSTYRLCRPFSILVVDSCPLATGTPIHL